VLVSVTFASGTVAPDASFRDLGDVVVLALDRHAGEPPHHGQLADVRERIGHGPLEQLRRRYVGGRGREGGVEPRESCEEAIDVGFPRVDRRVLPRLVSFGDGGAPVHEIPHVREDLSRRSRVLAGTEVGEARRGVAQDLAGAVGERRERMSQDHFFLAIG